MDEESRHHVTVHWFRHGLRLHDNPALVDGLNNCREFYPVFIFDENVAGIGTAAYPRMRFLFETLKDLDAGLNTLGTRLFVFYGKPQKIFEKLIEEWGVTRLTFEQDPEPIWQKRDREVKNLCQEKEIEIIERVSHTLWEPLTIMEENGGSPPLTYAMFCQVAEIVGEPPKPVETPNFDGIVLPHDDESHDSKYGLQSLESLGIVPECEEQNKPHCRYLGGETKALKLLEERLIREKKAFASNQCMPNQLYPELTGLPMSLSPHLRFGSLSIRKFFWSLRAAFSEVHPGKPVPTSITSQLIWREYFYCMSVNNIYYNQMKPNPICLNIDWYENEDKFNKWKIGQTGYPWIDAIMRQLLQEGWIHQVCRHAVACFLTRGDLWLSWEKGLEVFDKYLLDADWSVCAGNWMWVSSSAFENVLQCPRCICPVRYGRRMDPNGDYVRRYVPEVKNLPLKYLYEPWKAPLGVQEEAKCVVGTDYPQPMVDHKTASRECKELMERIKNISKDVPHVGPANLKEVLSLMWIREEELMDGVEQCNHNQVKVR